MPSVSWCEGSFLSEGGNRDEQVEGVEDGVEGRCLLRLEVALMKELGEGCSAVQEAVGRGAPDEVYLDAPGWSNVVAVAGRLAQVMVTNDLQAAALLHEQLNLPHHQEAC